MPRHRSGWACIDALSASSAPSRLNWSRTDERGIGQHACKAHRLTEFERDEIAGAMFAFHELLTRHTPFLTGAGEMASGLHEVGAKEISPPCEIISGHGSSLGVGRGNDQ
jgi:hypothetical protein